MNPLLIFSLPFQVTPANVLLGFHAQQRGKGYRGSGAITADLQATAHCCFCGRCMPAHICTCQTVLPNSLEANMMTVICRFLRRSYFIKGTFKSYNTKLAPEKRTIF